MKPISGSPSAASINWLTCFSSVKCWRARANIARPRPSMPGNRTATLPIGTSPPRFCWSSVLIEPLPRRCTQA